MCPYWRSQWSIHPTLPEPFTKLSRAAVAKGETSLPLDKFADLLIKLKIKLSKDLYIQLVDENLDELGIEVSEPLTKAQCSALYCKVYAAPVKHGPRLRKAAGRNDASLVTSLIARGCDINTADGNGHTPLHHATFHGICRDMIKVRERRGEERGGWRKEIGGLQARSVDRGWYRSNLLFAAAALPVREGWLRDSSCGR